MTHQHQPPRLLDQVRNAIRARHYSIRTEEAYLQWVRRFIYYHGKQHPKDLGETHVNQFLSHLAVKRRVAASTQNQALCALVFPYRHVLRKELGEFGDIVRAKRPVRLPEVLTREEIKRLMTHMDGIYKLMAGLMYGAGLRLMEAVRLRVKDVDFGYNRITVRDGKGGKDRYVPLAQGCRELLAVYLEQHTPATPGCLPQNYAAVPARAVRSKKPSGRPCTRPISTNPPRSIPCAIPTPPIFWKTALISASSRPRWGTSILPRPWFTLI